MFPGKGSGEILVYRVHKIVILQYFNSLSALQIPWTWVLISIMGNLNICGIGPGYEEENLGG